MLAVTLGGIFVVSALIGVLNYGLGAKLDDLRGRSRVIAEGHRRVGRRGSPWWRAVVAGDTRLRDRGARRQNQVEMEEEIATTRPSCRRARLASPIDLGEHRPLGAQTARAIVVLGPEDADARRERDQDGARAGGAQDARARRLSHRGPDSRHQEPHPGGDGGRAPGRAGDVERRDRAHRGAACRQSGLSAIYSELSISAATRSTFRRRGAGGQDLRRGARAFAATVMERPLRRRANAAAPAPWTRSSRPATRSW